MGEYYNPHWGCMTSDLVYTSCTPGVHEIDAIYRDFMGECNVLRIKQD